MLTFVIPVKSKQVSSDWSRFCDLFERTLKSVCNQTDNNFKVVVVCHEIPSINFSHENVHYVQVGFEPPIIKHLHSKEDIVKLREIDKGEKIKHGVDYACTNFNTDYVMPVDSDDFISNKIVAFINNDKSATRGWHIKRGYVHVEGKKFLFATKKFSDLCGSSIIVKPELLLFFFGTDEMFYFDHKLKILNNDIVLVEFPFPGGIYNMANRENHWMSFDKIKSLNNHRVKITADELKRIYNKIRNYSPRFITPSIKREFSLYSLK